MFSVRPCILDDENGTAITASCHYSRSFEAGGVAQPDCLPASSAQAADSSHKPLEHLNTAFVSGLDAELPFLWECTYYRYFSLAFYSKIIPNTEMDTISCWVSCSWTYYSAVIMSAGLLCIRCLTGAGNSEDREMWFVLKALRSTLLRRHHWIQLLM